MPSAQTSRPLRKIERHTLRTRDGHRIAFGIAGAPDGIPVVVLHGGPGSGSNPGVLELFDLARYRIVMIDQRGAGASRPAGSLRHNSTAYLIDDIESVRTHLRIERWGVLGGSWGATLALAYAGNCTQAVRGVVLRGLFLSSAREVDGLFITSRRRAPREWRRFAAAAQCSQPSRLFEACVRVLLHGRNPRQQQAVALAWAHYENAVLASAQHRRQARVKRRKAPLLRKMVGKYQIQMHYMLHRCWLGEPRLLSLARRAAQAGVPLAAAHGTRDPICPATNLVRLRQSVPQAQVRWVHAGHLGSDPALRDAVREAIRTMFG
ncbi:MAG TPA: alpha/beta fold hydrolase [Paraburkholderia sp.]|jgi:proline iminopeptidase|nr:alpha/beta fold hydrolase [Paraburkholderia sp.]